MPLHLEAAVADLGTSVARIDEPVTLDLVLERVPDGIVARGELSTPAGRASAAPASATSPPTSRSGWASSSKPAPLEGDTYPIEGHEIDLEQLVRDALLLELPLAPVCDGRRLRAGGRPRRAGRRRRRHGPSDAGPTDPRWAALSELEL